MRQIYSHYIEYNTNCAFWQFGAGTAHCRISGIWPGALFLQQGRLDNEVSDHYDTKYNTIPAEYLEVMLLNIAHQELYRENRYYKRNCHSQKQNDNFRTAEGKSCFEQF